MSHHTAFETITKSPRADASLNITFNYSDLVLTMIGCRGMAFWWSIACVHVMSDRSRDGETKQFNQEFSDEDFLNAVRECPVASTPNVADEIGCYRKTALRRLGKLEEQGEVGYEKVGGNARVWYVPGE